MRELVTPSLHTKASSHTVAITHFHSSFRPHPQHVSEGCSPLPPADVDAAKAHLMNVNSHLERLVPLMNAALWSIEVCCTEEQAQQLKGMLPPNAALWTVNHGVKELPLVCCTHACGGGGAWHACLPLAGWCWSPCPLLVCP